MCADTASLTPKSAPAAIAHTLLSATQHSRACEHDAAAQSCRLASAMLLVPHLPPKQMCHHFCAVRPSIQHLSSGNSASADATQHLPASGYDAATQSSYSVSPVLHTHCTLDSCSAPANTDQLIVDHSLLLVKNRSRRWRQRSCANPEHSTACVECGVNRAHVIDLDDGTWWRHW